MFKIDPRAAFHTIEMIVPEPEATQQEISQECARIEKKNRKDPEMRLLELSLYESILKSNSRYREQYREWGPIYYRFNGGGGSVMLKKPDYERITENQRHEPVSLYQNHDTGRNYWVYQNNLYWEDEKLSKEEVAALALALGKKHKRRIEKAIALISHEKEVNVSRQRIPDDVKQFVWQRDSGRCVKCGSQENLEFDHIIPVSQGGSNTARNIQILCEACNRSKSDTIG